MANRAMDVAPQGQNGGDSSHPDIPVWPLSLPARLARAVIQAGMLGVLPLWAPTRIEGRDALDGVEGPVLFAVNHVSHLDTSLVLRSLPWRWRRRTAVAAARDFFFKSRRQGFVAGLAFNAFPVSRNANLWPPLDQFRFLTGRGWSVVVYPEGTRSITGEILPFKAGIGLLAVQLGLPVVPVRIHGLASVLPKGRSWPPRRGHCTVHFGPPLRFGPGTSFAEATSAIEAAVRTL